MFFSFVFVFCASNSAVNMEIELKSFIADKMGKFLAIIMKITIHRKKIEYCTPKNIKFCNNGQLDRPQIIGFLKRRYIFADSAIFMMISIYSDPVFSKSTAYN